jgi:hypothetical protein
LNCNKQNNLEDHSLKIKLNYELAYKLSLLRALNPSLDFSNLEDAVTVDPVFNRKVLEKTQLFDSYFSIINDAIISAKKIKQSELQT